MIVAMILAVATPAQGEAKPVLTTEQTAIRRANMEMMERYYPKGALKRGEEGTVGVSVTTDIKGYPIDCEVVKSSGYRDLDSATCEVLLMYGRTKPFLDGNRKIVKTQTGEFVWNLPRGVARVQVAAANNQGAKEQRQRAVRDPNRMVCRVQTRTGTLADRQRICMTSAEWANQRNASQSDVVEMQRRQSMNN